MWAGLQARRVAAGSDRGEEEEEGEGSAQQRSSHHHCTASCAIISVTSGGEISFLASQNRGKGPIRDPLTLLEFAPIARNACGGLNLANSAPGVLATQSQSLLSV